MKRLFYLLLFAVIFSCGRKVNEQGGKIITVSIAPFKYFVEEIAGDNFKVNIMVPAGANPHIYEPSPGPDKQAQQVSCLYKQWIPGI